MRNEKTRNQAVNEPWLLFTEIATTLCEKSSFEKELNEKEKLDTIATFRPNVLIALTPRMLDASSGNHQADTPVNKSIAIGTTRDK